MTFSLDRLNNLLLRRENERLEFKEAKSSFEFDKLLKYCVALANEGGGFMVLGVSDKFPRRVVGTAAFENLERTKSGILNGLGCRVDIHEVLHPDGRVLVFEIPSRPIGSPMQYEGRYLMRGGEDLVPMTPDVLKRIFAEAGPDFSAEICPGATADDLDPGAIEQLRSRWMNKSGNQRLASLSIEQLLTDAELIVDGGIVYAALILLGTSKALGRHLDQAEVIFEYRTSGASGPAQQRKSFRQGYLLYESDLWSEINLRNDVQHFQEGFFVVDIPTFNERVIREAVNNAVCHREYRLSGSVYIRQYPQTLVVESPGGFPPGITLENLLWAQAPRNRRLAQVFEKCGIVERSGQGVNLMFEYAIRESKPQPDYSRSDASFVVVELQGEVQNPQFLRFLEKLGSEKMSHFETGDLLILDLLNRDLPIPEDLRKRLPALVEQGVIERIRSNKYMLSRSLYEFLGKKGVYTRMVGLDRETNKALLVKHIRDNGSAGSRFRELAQILPALSRGRIRTLLLELRTERAIHPKGNTSAALWFVGPDPDAK